MHTPRVCAEGVDLKAKVEFFRRAAPGRSLEDVLGKRWESATSLGTAIEDGLLWGLHPYSGISECLWVGVLVLRLHLSCVVPGGGVAVGSHAAASCCHFLTWVFYPPSQALSSRMSDSSAH